MSTTKKLKKQPLRSIIIRKKTAERNHVEGKFGQAKRGYSLNNIKARLPETSESWINAIFFITYLTKFLQLAKKPQKHLVALLKLTL